MTSFVQDQNLTLALAGEIDHHKARELMQVISRKIDEYLPRQCCLDFRDVSFMDSSGIAVVIHGVRRMRELDGTLILKNVRPQPMKILLAAGIERVVEIERGIPV